MYQCPPLVSPFGPGGSTAGPSGYCHSPPAPNAGFDVIGPVTLRGGFVVKSVAVQVVGPPPPPLWPVEPPCTPPAFPELPLLAPVPKSQPCRSHGAGVSAHAPPMRLAVNARAPASARIKVSLRILTASSGR